MDFVPRKAPVEIHYLMLHNYETTSDAVTFPSGGIVIRPSKEMLEGAVKIYFQASYDASALTSDGLIDLYDVDGSAVLARITAAAGSKNPSDYDSVEISPSAFTIGNRVQAAAKSDGTNKLIVYFARLVVVKRG